MFIHELCKAFDKAKLPYAIVGGYAVALHGAIRGTIDVDIVIKWDLDNLRKAEAVLQEIGLQSQLPIDADTLFYFRDEYIKNRNLIAWNFYDPKNPINQVDIIITYDLKKGHVKSLKTHSGKIKVLSIQDLIKMKKASGRLQDLEDVKSLEQL